MSMLLHVPAPLVAVLAMFMVIGLLAQPARTGWSTALSAAWAVVGLASATVWLLWSGLEEPELPEPAYLAVLGHTTTGITALVLACTAWHLTVARRRPGPSPSS